MPIDTIPSAPPKVTRLTTLTNVAQAVKATTGNLWGWSLINPNDEIVYVKFYDLAAGSVVVGTTPIVLTVSVPTNSFAIMEARHPQLAFASAISVAATKLAPDTDTTALDATMTAQILYK